MFFLIIYVILGFLISLILHECGHLLAARICKVPVSEIGFGWGSKLFGFRLSNVDCVLRLLPVGAYVRMNMTVLQQRPLIQQLSVLGAGVGVNLLLAALSWGTIFSFINLALAIGNMLPLYQHDGWKSGIVICRRILGRTSEVVEWTFTLAGGLIGLAVIAKAVI